MGKRSSLPHSRPLLRVPLWDFLRPWIQVYLRLSLGGSRRLPHRDSRRLLCGNSPRPLLGGIPHLWLRDFSTSTETPILCVRAVRRCLSLVENRPLILG